MDWTSPSTNSSTNNYYNANTNYYRPHQLRFENAQRFNQAMMQSQNIISDTNNNRVMRIRNSARTQRNNVGFGQDFYSNSQQQQQYLMNERDIKFANKLLFIFGLGAVSVFILLYKIYSYIVNLLLRRSKEKKKAEQPFSQILQQLEREWFPYKFSNKMKPIDDETKKDETQKATPLTEKQEQEIKDLIQQLKEDSREQEQQQKKQEQQMQQQKLFKKGILHLFRQHQHANTSTEPADKQDL